VRGVSASSATPLITFHHFHGGKIFSFQKYLATADISLRVKLREWLRKNI